MRIDESLDLSPEIDLSSLDPEIRRKVHNEVDDYNRFVLLLGCHPLTVHPEILMQYYCCLPNVASQDRRNLLKLLVFHGLWNQFWQVSVSDTTTLSDVEELVDLIYEQLSANNSSFLGIWQAVRAAREQTTNLGLFHSICEHIEYKFGVDKIVLTRFCEFVSMLDSVGELSELHLFRKTQELDNVVLRAFFHQKTAEILSLHQDSDLMRSFLQEILAETELFSSPGWVSFLLSFQSTRCLAAEATPLYQEPSFFGPLEKQLLHKRLGHYNDLDYLHLVQNLGPHDAYILYISVCKNIKRGLVKSNFILNFPLGLSLAANNHELTTIVTKKLHKSLNIDIWKQLLPGFLDDVAILKKLQNDQPERFTLLANWYLDKGGEGVISLVQLAKSDSKFVRRALKTLSSSHETETLSSLVQIDFSAYNFLELWRFSLRHGIVNEDTNLILDKVLHKTWNVEEFERRARNVNFQSTDDFRFYYGIASRKEKQALLHNIDAMAQAISQTEPEFTALVLNSLHHFVYSPQFTFVKSEVGKAYIFDRLVARSMHFIYRLKTSTPKKGVMIIRHILTKLKFNSITMQGSLFEYIVRDEPHIAIDILKTYSKNKSFLVNELMEAVVRGVLRTLKLDEGQRLEFFEHFRRRMTELGYKSKLSAKSTVLLGNLACKVAENGTREDLTWVIDLAHERGVPLAVVKNWSHRLRRK